ASPSSEAFPPANVSAAMDPSERLTKTKSRPPIPADPERRILITGGAGFLGVNAAVHLIKEGWFVTLLDNLSRPGTERNLKWLITRYPNRTSFIKEDVRNASALAEHVRDQDRSEERRVGKECRDRSQR